MRNYLTEFIGTFFLVLTIGLTVLGGTPLAIGCSLMIMVYMGGHVSGGHYNPAVSLAVFLRGKMTSSAELIRYWVAQIVGAIVAALTVWCVTGKTFAPTPAPDASTTAALTVFYGLAIGFTIVVAAFAGGPISGGAFNPAVGLGPTVIHATMGEGGWAFLWLYLVGPLLGGAVAAWVFGLQEAK
jgi:aquaporin Z